MSRTSVANIFRRLTFMEGEWKGSLSNRDVGRFADELRCRIEEGKLVGVSSLTVDGEEVGTRRFDIWVEEDSVLGRWEIDGQGTETYVCEYEGEKDEFLFNLRNNPTSIDYRTIRRLDMMHFITMEQLPREGTSSVETLQMEYTRTQ